MKKRYFLIILVLFTFLNIQYSNATHVQGGEITWQCVKEGIDKGKFIFKVRIYRVCYQGVVGLPTTASISNPLYTKYGGPSTIICVVTQTSEITQSCYDPNYSPSCGKTKATIGLNVVEERMYESSKIALNGIPDSLGSDFSWTHCCRTSNTELKNIYSGGYYLRATMFPYTKPGTSSPQTLGSATSSPSCYDSSPQYAQMTSIVACGKQQSYFDYGTTDEECDSLVYSWSQSMLSDTIGVTYKAGYGLVNQLPDSNIDSLNQGPFIDPTTGIVSFWVESPLNSGHFNVGTRAYSYRDGQLIAAVYKDHTVLINDCDIITSTPTVKNTNAPTIELKEKNSTTFQSAFSKTYQIGATIELDIKVEDFDFLPTNPVSSQSVSIEVSGLSMSTDVNNTTKCTNGPCAFLDSNNVAWNNPIFIDTNSMVVRFKWTPGCSSLDNKPDPLCGMTGTTYEFTIVARDNWCPVPKTSRKTFYITLQDTIAVPWNVDTLDASQTGTYLSWTDYNAPDFIKYNVYRKYGFGDSWIFRTFTTLAAQSYYYDGSSNSNSQLAFYMVTVNNNPGCTTENQVRTMYLSAVKSLQNTVLTWNLPYVDAAKHTTGQYKVYRQDSTSTWTYLGGPSYGYESYLDVSPPVNTYLKYKVVSNDAYGLYSVSNIDSIYFKKISDTTWKGLNEFDISQIKVFPNPAKDQLTVELDREVTMDILSLQGKIENSIKLKAQLNRVDLSELKSGLYFLRFTTERGDVGYKKIVKSD